MRGRQQLHVRPAGFRTGPFGVVFAFQVLPIIIFIASFFSILYYLGIMQWVVHGMAVGMQKVMGVSGAESLNVAASIFMGQTEAPLTIKPFIAGMTESELFTVMASGMAHVSGAVMAAYVLVAHVEIQHLLTAVIMTAPATIMLAKIFIPENGEAGDRGQGGDQGGEDGGECDRRGGAGRGRRAAPGAQHRRHADRVHRADRHGQRHSGLGAHAACCMGWLPDTLQKIFGLIFAPVAWIMGVSWKDASAIGNLLGTRLVLNEFVAFMQLGPMKAHLDPRSFTIATYALCGFANFSSIAIQIGGIGALAPNRKSDLARLGIRAVAAGIDGQFHVGLHRGDAAVIEEAEAYHREQQRCAARHRRGAGQRIGRVRGRT